MERNNIFEYNYKLKPTNRNIDENGFLTVKNCYLLHDGIIEYNGFELGDYVDGVKIDPEKRYRVNINYNELVKAKDTFSMKPVTYGHVFLGANGKNSVHYQEGSVGENIEIVKDVDVDGVEKNFILATLAFTNQDTVNAIVRGKKQELSASYSNTLKVAKPGSNYDFEATDIVGNHIALVKKGKAGSKVRVANENLENINEESIMENETEQNIKVQEIQNSEVNTEQDIEDVSIDENKSKDENVLEQTENDIKKSVISNSNSDFCFTEVNEAINFIEEFLNKAKSIQKTKVNNSEEIYENIKQEIRQELENENKNRIIAYNEVKSVVGDFDFSNMSEVDIYKKGLKSYKSIIFNEEDSVDTLKGMFKVAKMMKTRQNVNFVTKDNSQINLIPDYIRLTSR